MGGETADPFAAQPRWDWITATVAARATSREDASGPTASRSTEAGSNRTRAGAEPSPETSIKTETESTATR